MAWVWGHSFDFLFCCTYFIQVGYRAFETTTLLANICFVKEEKVFICKASFKSSFRRESSRLVRAAKGLATFLKLALRRTSNARGVLKKRRSMSFRSSLLSCTWVVEKKQSSGKWGFVSRLPFFHFRPAPVFTSATYLIYQTNQVMITVKDKCE